MFIHPFSKSANRCSGLSDAVMALIKIEEPAEDVSAPELTM
jgi:hypothetical protein